VQTQPYLLETKEQGIGTSVLVSLHVYKKEKKKNASESYLRCHKGLRLDVFAIMTFSLGDRTATLCVGKSVTS